MEFFAYRKFETVEAAELDEPFEDGEVGDFVVRAPGDLDRENWTVVKRAGFLENHGKTDATAPVGAEPEATSLADDVEAAAESADDEENDKPKSSSRAKKG